MKTKLLTLLALSLLLSCSPHVQITDGEDTSSPPLVFYLDMHYTDTIVKYGQTNYGTVVFTGKTNATRDYLEYTQDESEINISNVQSQVQDGNVSFSYDYVIDGSSNTDIKQTFKILFYTGYSTHVQIDTWFEYQD